MLNHPIKTDRSSVWEFAVRRGYLPTIEKAIDTLTNRPGLTGIRHHVLNRLKDYRLLSVDRTRRAGQYSSGDMTIELHEQLFQPGKENVLKETFLHEVGHYLDHKIMPRPAQKKRRIIRWDPKTQRNYNTYDWFTPSRGHGETWRKCMAALGQPNEERCHHDAEILSSVPHIAELTCQDCGWQWKPTRCTEYNGRWHPACRRAQKPNRGELKLTWHRDWAKQPQAATV